MFFLLILLVVQYVLGYVLVRKVFISTSFLLFNVVFHLTVGIIISIPILYILDIFLNNNILYTYSIFISLGIFLIYRFNIHKQLSSSILKENFLDVCFLVLISFFSFYIMHKTFRIDGQGGLIVGSHEVFDVGHNLSIVRSFSWGDNVPYLSPFVSGAVDIYHFFFYYWVGLIERLGVSIQYALNIPSVISFTLLLLVVYYFPILLMGAKRIVGVLSILFVVSHSTLTWWYFLLENGISSSIVSKIWRLPTYMFTAPYDGSAISIYHTLNVYVNQRHLALPLAFGLLLYISNYLSAKKNHISKRLSLISGLLIGIMPYWHIILSFGFGLLISSIYVIYRKWQHVLIFGVTASIIALIELLPWIVNLTYSSVSGDISTINALRFSSEYSFVYTIFVNYGIAILTVPLGVYMLRPGYKKIVIPFLLLIVGSYVLKLLIGSEIEQKFLNLFLIIIACVSAYGIYALWNKTWFLKVLSIFATLMFMGSGIIDVMVIKNDYMYRIPFSGENELINWIHRNTPPTSVFLSYADIFDPVTLAGRRNYWGFFRNMGQPNRIDTIHALYSQASIDNPNLFKQENIQYVVFPLISKDGFVYRSSLPLFEKSFPVVYKNDEIVIFDVNSGT